MSNFGVVSAFLELKKFKLLQVVWQKNGNTVIGKGKTAQTKEVSFAQ